MKRKSIATTMFIIFGKHNFELATFLGAYGGIFKVYLNLMTQLKPK
jgi:hypothetical protein